MSPIDEKINEHFSGLVVRKDLVKTVKGNAIVPSYVLEYLLGQYCATHDEASILSGIETVKEILRKHYVHRNQAGLVRSNIRETGRYKVIDKISVDLNDREDVYEAAFSNLGIKEVLVEPATVKAHPKMLVSGIWCIAELEYIHGEEKNGNPWVLTSLKPIQLSHFDYEGYLAARAKFSTDEWIDLLIQSMGFNPEMFGTRSKLNQLVRLIPFCERNYNLIELGPKGTGKSHIYSEFSPHGILVSGGEVTVPKLFVNNSSGKIGLVGYWDTIALDEFAGKQKRPDKALVDILKNYMANKTFSRGIEPLGAEASMVFVGNTSHTVPYMLKHTDLFDELPDNYHDSAFLDRIHFYVPGWEVDIIRGEMFSDGYGFVVDYLAEILRSLRSHDFSDRYKSEFRLSSDISTRDRDAIHKSFSGLMKILFPHGESTREEVEMILRFAIEGRKRVKDQLMRIDHTYAAVNFTYENAEGKRFPVTTLEEEMYPEVYHSRTPSTMPQATTPLDATPAPQSALGPLPAEMNKEEKAKEGHVTVREGQKGITFDQLFGTHLQGASQITVTDPYVRLFYQVRNVMEFVESVVRLKAPDEEVGIHLVTVEDDFKADQQKVQLERIQTEGQTAGIQFTWSFDDSGSLHARHICTDTGWKILLDRGLDIYQHYEMNDALAFANRLQQFRSCKAFEVTYIRQG